MIWLILLIGFLLRIVFLNQSLWLDEAIQAITSQGSFAGIFAELRGDFHPPLYHLLMWTWVHLFGSSEIVLRLPSVIFGTVTIYVVYLIVSLANSFTSEEPLRVTIRGVSFLPLLAALFLATAPFHIYYSQEARPYALVTLLVACSMYFFLKEKWLGYIASTSLALYSSYFVLFLILAQGIVILLRRKANLLLYCYIAILLLFLPCLPLFLVQLKTGSQAIQTLPEWGRLVNLSFLKALPLTFIKFSLGRITIFNKTFYAAVAGILFLIYGSIIARGFFRKKKFIIHNSLFIILAWFLIPILSAWLISLFIPNYQPFRLLLVLPAFYLLLAYGVSRIGTPIIRNLIVGIVLTVNLVSLKTYFFNPYFHREDWRGVVGYIEKQGTKDSTVILPSSTSGAPWQYYSSGKVRLIGIASGVKKVTQEDFDNVTIEQFNNRTIYYIRYLVPLFDPQEKIALWLMENGFVKIEEISFNQIPLWEYRRISEL